MSRLLEGPPRVIDGAETLRLAEILAAALLESLPSIEAADFRPIPRGGHFVLGYLAYLMALPERCTTSRRRPGAPLVLVDDCAASGARLRAALRRGRGPAIVAHLCSPAPFREAVLRREPRVLACLAAADLRDETPIRIPDEADRAAWRESCAERWGRSRYWVGISERVAFPWSEPDSPFWGDSGPIAAGWRWRPPHLCLRNRAEVGPNPSPGRRAEYILEEGIAYLAGEDGVTLYAPGTGELVGLEGTAAEVWRMVVAGGAVERVAACLAARYDVALDRARADVEALIADLVDRGILRPVGAAGVQGTG